MATLVDLTIQHSGWNGSTYATAGWDDDVSISVAGQLAGSFWWESINGQVLDFAIQLYDGPSSLLATYYNQHTTGGSGAINPPNGQLLTPGWHWHFYTRVPSNNDQVLVRVVITDQPTTPPPTTPPCQYGTQPKSTAVLAELITAELINAVCSAVGMPWLGIAFTVLVGTYLQLNPLCDGPPPPFPALSTGLLSAPIDQVMAAFESVAWPYFCQCIAGTPAPVPYPPPTGTQPPGWPGAPVVPCSDTDLCTTLEQMAASIFAIQQIVASDLSLVTLLQRYRLPFAYIEGANHMSLQGQGTFAVQGLVGFWVQVPTYPATNPQSGGNPPYIYDLGWVSIETGDGMIDEHRLSRTAFIWTPPNAALAINFGYFLREGVVANVIELKPEP